MHPSHDQAFPVDILVHATAQKSSVCDPKNLLSCRTFSSMATFAVTPEAVTALMLNGLCASKASAEGKELLGGPTALEYRPLSILEFSKRFNWNPAGLELINKKGHKSVTGTGNSLFYTVSGSASYPLPAACRPAVETKQQSLSHQHEWQHRRPTGFLLCHLIRPHGRPRERHRRPYF